ncbi:putative aldouronate transport system substrate-binding protein [Paenibacillus sp. 1_12]|uniref:extracellular solute-binding protein n=1 Tax=Paenibacillus sp. 1_12 TaxID=1566278 RepID=UPI0008F41FF9|nr:extracellular solute-binding protein [Paenibacillus sp. 1_12]SFL74305.1 putative aldouronate transport system substrate-binding protein [Paenibacillus sp. 1_12]
MNKGIKMNNRIWKRTASTMLVTALVGVTAACGSNPSTPASSGDAAAKAPSGPVKLKLAYDVGNAIPSTSADSNEAMKYLQDKLGVQFEFNVNAYEIYKEKIRVQIASGDIPDAFAWRTMDDFIVGMIKAGEIVPLDDYIDKYPNLKKQKELDITRYQNKIWAITNVRNPVASGDAPLIRQDWLDNLGLQAPKTLDDLYNVAKAFSLNDPDKNGKKDTYGIQLGYANNAFVGIGGLQKPFGIQDKWVKQPDGKYVPNFATPAFKEYLTWMNKAFKDGLIDPDFAVTDGRTAESKVVGKGQAGIFFHYMSRVNDFEDNFKKANPTAKLVPFEPVKGASGLQGATGRVNYGGMFVSKKAGQDPAKMQKLMEWFDFGASPEGQNFNLYGVDGIHSVKKDGKIEVKSDLLSRDMPGTFIATLPLQPTEEVFVSKKNSEEAQKIVADGNKMLEKFLKIPKPLDFAFSPTGAKYNAEAEAFINTSIVKVIMGNINVSEWDGIVKQWYDRFEGAKWIEEIAATDGK